MDVMALPPDFSEESGEVDQQPVKNRHKLLTLFKGHMANITSLAFRYVQIFFRKNIFLL